MPYLTGQYKHYSIQSTSSKKNSRPSMDAAAPALFLSGSETEDMRRTGGRRGVRKSNSSCCFVPDPVNKPKYWPGQLQSTTPQTPSVPPQVLPVTGVGAAGLASPVRSTTRGTGFGCSRLAANSSPEWEPVDEIQQKLSTTVFH